MERPAAAESRPTRRAFLRTVASLTGPAAGMLAAAAHPQAQQRVTLPFENGARELVAFPQKRPLIVLTSRPPQLETPFSVFDEGLITPNDAFFVRYHWAGLPLSVDAATYRLRVTGLVERPLDLSLADLKGVADPVEIIAVNQCSGNSRGHFTPRVNGGQLSNGAMGSARWTGVPLARVLQKAGVKAGAVQVSFNGLDQPPIGDGPDFVKALPIDHALDGEVLVAWQMNGEDLPFLNGYPVRLVVPGYFGTYWIKHLSEIEVLGAVYDGFWMSSAYRIPDNPCACVAPGAAVSKTTPIGRFDVRSFITSVRDGATVPAGAPLTLRGIAFDSGYGIADVSWSVDGGRTWQAADLAPEQGRYAFRGWTSRYTPPRPGPYELRVRATNRIGQSQPMEPLWNPAGYMRNVVETTRITAQ